MVGKIVIGLASIALGTVIIPLFGLMVLGKFFNKIFGDEK